MNAFPQTHRNLAWLLATGQLTQYGGYLDDGYYRKGIAKSYTVLTAGQYSGSTNITLNGKTDAHSNACVYDNNTHLMWSRTSSGSVGPNSNGTLPWTTNANGEGIFAFCAAANTAGLAGYSDWRVPKPTELYTLVIGEAPSGGLDAAAFPGGLGNCWSSMTRPDSTADAVQLATSAGAANTVVKTTNRVLILVRGGR